MTVAEFQIKQATVTATPAQIMLRGALRCYHGVLVKALKANTAVVFVGYGKNVGSNGFELQPGDEVLVPVDLPEKLWAVSAEGSQTVCLLLA